MAYSMDMKQTFQIQGAYTRVHVDVCVCVCAVFRLLLRRGSARVGVSCITKFAPKT